MGTRFGRDRLPRPATLAPHAVVDKRPPLWSPLRSGASALGGNVFLRRNGMQASMITRELRRSVLGVVAHRIERRTPAAMDDVDLVARIAARAHRPHHVIEVGRVDVVVHHDGPAVVVGAGVAMRRHHGGLLGMPAVERLDRDDHHEAAAAGFVRPHAFHVRDAGGFELVPDRAARDRRRNKKVLSFGGTAGIAPIRIGLLRYIKRLDADRGLTIAAAGADSRSTRRAALP